VFGGLDAAGTAAEAELLANPALTN